MKGLPPHSNNNPPHHMTGPHQKIHSPEKKPGQDFDDSAFKALEKELGKVDKNLNELVGSFKDQPTLGKAFEKLTQTLQHMEEEIKNLIDELKKNLTPEEKKELKKELTTELKKFEQELKEVSQKFDQQLKKEVGQKGEHKDLEKKKKTLDLVQGEISTLAQQLKSDQILETQSAKGAAGLEGLNTRTEVSKTIALIQKMVAQIQVGNIQGTTFTNVELKNTADLPSYFANANMTITPGADGKMSVQFTNLTEEQTQAAIYAIEQHPELLLTLLDRISLSKLQIGDHVVTLPSTESREERGGGERGGGGEQGRQGREQEER